MYCNEDIVSAETNIKQRLEDFFCTTWGKKVLFSHDITHHRRVWSFAKELFPLQSEDPVCIPFSAMELIVACYLHDIGMAFDTGPKHGRISASVCSAFLKENDLDISLFKNALNAIESHDNKEYRSLARENRLLELLSCADDLDAFGFTGIYRYLEIYIIRGIRDEELGYMIRENAANRLNHFISVFGSNIELIAKHKKRHAILDIFFERYNKDLPMISSSGKINNSSILVKNLIADMLKNGQSPLEAAQGLIRVHKNEKEVVAFFDGLFSELSELQG